MPKILILVRHAKTETAGLRQRDFDRELKPKGHTQAEAMGRALLKKGVMPEYMLSSPAVRARQTAGLLARHTGLDAGKILFDESLYNASAGTLAEVIRQSSLPADAGTLLLVAHNPGISELALQCAPDLPIGYLPTCGMVLLETNTRFWADFSPGACRFISLELP